MKEYSVDIMSGCKTQVDWSFAKENKKFENLSGKRQDRRHIFGYNKTEKSS
jgi:hypothetical protein